MPRLPRVQSNSHIRLYVAFLAILLGLAPQTYSSIQAATLQRQLLKYAPQLLRELRKRDCHRIGVLKFLVRKAGGRSSDNVGTLNTLLAERLEVALALANSTDASEQVQLVHNASAVAARNPKASHLSQSGRKQLFSQHYPSSWGGKEIEVDAFVTGVVEVAADLRSLRIGIWAAIRNEPELQSLLNQFTVDTDGTILNEIGESFQLRTVLGHQDQEQEPAALAREVRRDPSANFPLENKPTVALRIYYAGQPVTLTFNETEATIPEPRAGQTVTLELERMDQANVVLGVVLKVNGENTLYRQQMRDFDCAKWVLTREHPKTTIRGFQRENNTKNAEVFQVSSHEESRALEMHYGPDVGTISLVVFQQASEAPMLSLCEDAPDLLAIEKAQFPAEPPRNSEALKAQLRNGEEDGTRGIITEGTDIQQNIRLVSHHWNPEPIMSVVIRYYRPQN